MNIALSVVFFFLVFLPRIYSSKLLDKKSLFMDGASDSSGKGLGYGLHGSGGGGIDILLHSLLFGMTPGFTQPPVNEYCHQTLKWPYRAETGRLRDRSSGLQLQIIGTTRYTSYIIYEYQGFP